MNTSKDIQEPQGNNANRVLEPVFQLSKFERWVLSIVRDCGLIIERPDRKFDFSDESWEMGAYKPISRSVINRLFSNGYLRKVELSEGSMWYDKFQGTDKTESLFTNGF